MQDGAGAGAGLDGMQTAAGIIRTGRSARWFFLGSSVPVSGSFIPARLGCFPSRVVPFLLPFFRSCIVYRCAGDRLRAGVVYRARVIYGVGCHCVHFGRVVVVQGVQVLFLLGQKETAGRFGSAVVVYRGGLSVKRCGRSFREGLSSRGGHVRGRRPSGRGWRRGVSLRPADRCPAGRRSLSACSR